MTRTRPILLAPLALAACVAEPEGIPSNEPVVETLQPDMIAVAVGGGMEWQAQGGPVRQLLVAGATPLDAWARREAHCGGSRTRAQLAAGLDTQPTYRDPENGRWLVPACD